MKIFLHSFFFLFTCLFIFASPSVAQEKKWMLVPFVKQDAVNPCLVPSKAAFTDPIRKSKVAWEEKDVFNPAAVVRNNKVYLLYRAQDVIGLPAGLRELDWHIVLMVFILNVCKNRFYILIMMNTKSLSGKVVAKIHGLWRMIKELII